MPSSLLERRFAWAWETWGDPALPKPLHDKRFHPTRKWRWDFQWPDLKVAVDIQGGTYVYGKHSRGSRQTDDFEKMNEATRLGWTVIHLDTTMLPKRQTTLQDTIKLVVSILQQANMFRTSLAQPRKPILPRNAHGKPTQSIPRSPNTRPPLPRRRLPRTR